MLKYLTLSVCAHTLIVLAADIDKLPNNSPQPPVLKVNLMARAAPVSPPTFEQAASVSLTVPKKFLTETRAVKKIAATERALQTPVKHLQTKEAALIESVDTLSRASGKLASTVIHKANYRRQTPPVYPRRALELGQEGTVTLHAEVIPTGRPRTLKVAESSGHRLLDRAALDAVRKWEFEPKNVDGSMVTSWVRVPMRFVIRE